MLSRLTKIAIIFGLSVIVSSCTTLSTIKIDVLKPAVFSVPPDIVSVVVVDNALPFRDENVHVISTPKQVLSIDSVWVDNFGEIATKALAESLIDKNFFDSVYYHPVSTNRNYLNPHFGELPNYMIDSLCNVYNAQAVISLEAVKYNSKMIFTDFGESYYASLDVNGLMYWKMYANNGFIMDAYLQKDTIFWDNSDVSFNRALTAIPVLRESIEIIGWHMGRKAAKRISPYWETANRYFFSGGNYLFLRATDLQASNNWEEAAKVWYHIYENAEKRQKARAAMNIALSYEVRGNFPEAVVWADISRKIFEGLGFFNSTMNEKTISKLYYLQLCERNQERKKLDEQFGL